MSFVQSCSGGSPFYSIPRTAAIDFRHSVGGNKSIMRDIDTREVVLGHDELPLPLHYALPQAFVEKKVFEVDKLSSLVKLVQIGCL